jgi:5-dehydro-2-deoxygluconokinase
MTKYTSKRIRSRRNKVERDFTRKQLLILAFDHRSSFTEKLFNIRGRLPTLEEKKEVSEYKRNIFEGFKKAVDKGVSKRTGGLLVDEEFGADILREAKTSGYIFAMPVEKSGQEEFDFQYGDRYRTHIESFGPTYVKVLVRYDTEGDKNLNQRQTKRLKMLSDYLHITHRPFLFELLVPPTSQQLAKTGGSKETYDLEVRPRLMVAAMNELQLAGIEPDIWKLEGVEREGDAKSLVEQAQAGGRKAGVITLGRGESKELVEKWLKTGSSISGVIGFAVGRTIFWDPLVELKAGKISRQSAIDKIAQNYLDLVNLWQREKA